jgi:hypothetical protein
MECQVKTTETNLMANMNKGRHSFAGRTLKHTTNNSDQEKKTIHSSCLVCRPNYCSVTQVQHLTNVADFPAESVKAQNEFHPKTEGLY